MPSEYKAIIEKAGVSEEDLKDPAIFKFVIEFMVKNSVGTINSSSNKLKKRLKLNMAGENPSTDSLSLENSAAIPIKEELAHKSPPLPPVAPPRLDSDISKERPADLITSNQDTILNNSPYSEKVEIDRRASLLGQIRSTKLTSLKKVMTTHLD